MSTDDRDLSIIVAELEKEVEQLKNVINSMLNTQEDHNQILAALVGMPEEEITFEPSEELLEALNEDKKSKLN